jgi:hypothetical protein
VIEVIGGVHTLTAERDAARIAALRAQGLTVITLTNEQLYQGEANQLFAHLCKGARLPHLLTRWCCLNRLIVRALVFQDTTLARCGLSRHSSKLLITCHH